MNQKITNNKNMVINNDFGARLRRVRKDAGISQVALAEKLHVSRTCVTNWEGGLRIPNHKYVMDMAVIFHVPTDYFYGLSNHRYDIKIPEYIELDLSRLNGAGIDLLCEFFRFLASNKKYSNNSSKS